MRNTIDMIARTRSLSALGAAVLSLLLAFSPTVAFAQTASLGKEKPTVVLVHGAWADGSSWNGVISRLLKSGYTVYAPPIRYAAWPRMRQRSPHSSSR